MKEGIHPNYEQTTIRCACGAVIETGSTKQDIKVEICSKCHPFYTGKQKLVDTASTRSSASSNPHPKPAPIRCGLFSIFRQKTSEKTPIKEVFYAEI